MIPSNRPRSSRTGKALKSCRSNWANSSLTDVAGPTVTGDALIISWTAIIRRHSPRAIRFLNLLQMITLTKAETDPSDRRQQRLAGGVGELSAQVPNVDIDHVAIGVKVHVPHLLQQGGAADNFLRVKKEVLQELELLGCEVQPPIVHCGHVTKPIEGNRAVAQHIEALCAAPTMEARIRASSSSKRNGLAR